ncbi:MAG: gluconate 2-dehydrogenase subunit 3 family protein [Myxococcales bacterium]
MAVTRRGFLKRTLLGTAALAAAGGVPLALRRTRLRPLPPGLSLRFFTLEEYAIFAAVADRIVPKLAPDQPTAEELSVPAKADALLSRADPDTRRDFKQLLGLFDNALASLLLDGRATPFTRASPAEQDRALSRWRQSRLPLRRSGFQGLSRLASALYYSDARSYAGVGYPGPPLLMRPDGTAVGGTAAERAAALAARAGVPK